VGREPQNKPHDLDTKEAEVVITRAQLAIAMIAIPMLARIPLSLLRPAQVQIR
jgi:hypothetical protein